MVAIQSLTASDWQLYKHVRLSALSDAPYAFTAKYADLAQLSDEEWREKIKSYAGDPKSLTVFAFIDADPVGMAVCVLSEKPKSDLLAMWVAPLFRTHGIGKALVSHLVRWAAGQGFTELHAGVTNDNDNACRFYLSLGFKEIRDQEPSVWSSDAVDKQLKLHIQE